METLFQDIKYAFRTMRKAPAFTAIAILTIALGVGANTAIFSVVNALMMRSLPVEDPGKLDVLGKARAVNWLSMGSPRIDLFSLPMYREIERGTQAYSSIAAVGRVRDAEVIIPGQNVSEQSKEKARGRFVSGNYFSTLGLRPVIGRTFTADEDRESAAPVTVISYAYWQRRFNGDRNVVGQTIKVNNYPLTIIGVLPEGYYGDVIGEHQDYYVPLMMQAALMPGHDWLKRNDVSWLLMIGRRKPGLSLEQARAATQLEASNIINSDFGAKFSEDDRNDLKRRPIDVTEGGKGLSALREQMRKPLVLLTIIVGLVLLIACVNVANLLLAKSSARQNEMAVRLALGASSTRIVRQLITESIVLALTGGAVGLVLAGWLSKGFIRAVTSATVEVPLDLSLDSRVLAVSFAISIFTGILFGLAPALRTRSIDLTPALKASARSSVGGAVRPSLGKILVAGQLVISVCVLFCALLLVRSLQQLQKVDPGFQRDGLLSATVDFLPAGYDVDKVKTVAADVRERMSKVPGVSAVSFGENGLFTGSQGVLTILVDGARPSSEEARASSYEAAGPNFLTTVGLPLTAGRDIGEQDTATAPRVAVINDSFAKFYFPGQNPIGHTIAIDDPAEGKKPMQIVGVVRDSLDRELKEKPERRFNWPYTQYGLGGNGTVTYEIRVSGDTGQAAQAFRRIVHEVNPAIGVREIETVKNLMERDLRDDFTMVRMTGFFAALALVLACIGLYGVISYSVAGRTREIGVRIALGANRADVLWLILREALILIAFGIGIGVPLSTLATKAMQSMMYGVTSLDPVVVTATVAVLGSVGALAAYIPARRATKVDPMVALRYE